MDVVSVIIECQKHAQHQGLSLTDLADAIGVSKGQVGNWLNQRRTPSADNLFALVAAVGLKIQLRPEHHSKEEPGVLVSKLQTTVNKPLEASRSKRQAKKESKPSKLAATRAARVFGIPLGRINLETLDAECQELMASEPNHTLKKRAEEARSTLETWLGVV